MAERTSFIVGEEAGLTKTITDEEIRLFAVYPERLRRTPEMQGKALREEKCR